MPLVLVVVAITVIAFTACKANAYDAINGLSAGAVTQLGMFALLLLPLCTRAVKTRARIFRRRTGRRRTVHRKKNVSFG